ncbi:MAG: RecQ family ATP-dependent DNA helicase [Phocaeicola sp.]
MTYQEILKQYWGYDAFRGIQQDIIESIGNGHDTLGLMPTGGGKSITFQVPALAKEGVCLVVTPLIALMKDQVRNLRERGIKAVAIYSGMSKQEIVVALENCIFGDYKFLYISPERLDTELFQAKLKSMKVSMITIDESHCISQWGYDFRPAYLNIAAIRQLLPGIPVLALTATATPEVVVDIQQRLDFKEGRVFRMSFERSNLAYIIRATESKEEELLHILNRMQGCAIIYTRNRKRTKEVAELLSNHAITATFYHAGLSNSVKDQRQKSWLLGESRVMVATNAFGMGIDKPDVRIVIHIDMPDSPEAYFQEAGRAGRDGEKAYAVLLFAKGDKAILTKRISDTFPPKEYISKVYEDLNSHFQMAMGDGLGCTYAFNLEEFCRNFKHFPVQADSALKILTRAGYIEYTDEQENASRILFTIRRDELYRLRDDNPDVEKLIHVVLRSYTGLFTDYAYIHEDSLAVRTGLSRQQIYDILLLLTRRHVLHYIPYKKTPYLIYTRERQGSVFIPKEVYEDRKASYEKRIHSMITYATAQDKCRSRMLLYYFGEKNEHNCGQCDYCLQRHRSGFRQGEYEELSARIRKRLGEGMISAAQLAQEMKGVSPIEQIEQLLSFLIAEEEIRLKDGMLCWKE